MKGPKICCENQICGHNTPVTLWQKPLYDEIVPILTNMSFAPKKGLSFMLKNDKKFSPPPHWGCALRFSIMHIWLFPEEKSLSLKMCLKTGLKLLLKESKKVKILDLAEICKKPLWLSPYSKYHFQCKSPFRQMHNSTQIIKLVSNNVQESHFLLCVEFECCCSATLATGGEFQLQNGYVWPKHVKVLD